MTSSNRVGHVCRGVLSSGLLLRLLALILAASGLIQARSAPCPDFFFSVDPAFRETVAGEPLSVEIIARDPFGSPVPDCAGTVTLTATVPGTMPKVLIGEWSFELDASLELVNVSAEAVDLANWSVYTYSLSNASSGPWGGFIFPGPAVCPPGGMVILRSRGPAPGAFPVFAAGASPLLPRATGRIAAVLLDSNGAVMDAVHVGSRGLGGTITEPAPVPESVWSGDPAGSPVFDRPSSLQRVGRRNHGSAVDWIVAPPSVGMVNAGLELPFIAAEETIPMSPNVVELIDGKWQGAITITAPASNVLLRADDQVGHVGTSATVQVRPKPSLVLVLPDRIRESDAGPIHGAIEIPGPLSTDLVVGLQSSDSSEVLLPSSVTLVAGTTRKDFEGMLLDDALLDGTQSVSVTASSSGWAEATSVVACEDDESGELRLSLPVTMRKDDLRSSWSAEVRATRPVDKRVAIELHTDRPDLMRLPSRVDLMPGEVRAAFSIRAAGDYRLTGDQEAVITAQVAHWQTGRGTLTVQDPYRRVLALLPITNLVEGMGSTDVAALQLPGRLSSNLMVRLITDPPGVLGHPADVTVPAGESQVILRADVAEDSLFSGTRLVTMRAEADGFESASTEIQAIDNDLKTFRVEGSSGAFSVGQPIEITVTARNASGDLIPTYQGAFTLRPKRGDGGTIGTSLPAEIQGFLTQGIWRGIIRPGGEVPSLVLEASNSEGVTGQSTAIDVAEVRMAPVAAAHLIADPHRDRLLASVMTPTAEVPNGIVAIDPFTGAVTRLVPLETGVRQLAMSDDGVYLYASAAEGREIFRIRMDTSAVDRRWDIGAALEGRPDNPFSPPYLPYSLHSVAGQPKSVVVCLSRFGEPSGAVVFDDDQLRPRMLVSPGVFADSASESPQGDASSLRLFARGLLGQGRVTASGVFLERSIPGPRHVTELPMPDGVPLQVTLGDRLAYQSDGWILDPEHYELRAIAPVTGPVIRDHASGRVHYLRWNSTFREVVSLDVSSLRPVARLVLPGRSEGITSDFIRWGRDGFGFRTWGGEVHLIRSAYLVPTPSATDLGIAALAPTGTLSVGEPIWYTITVTNRGPAVAEAVVVEDVLPPDTELLEAGVPAGDGSHTNGVAHFRLGRLSVGQQARFDFSVRSRSPLDGTHRIRVLGGGMDTVDDFIEVRQVTTLGPVLPRTTAFWTDGMAMVHDRTRNRLYLSGIDPESNQGRLRVLDLNRGVFEPPVPVPDLLRKLAITSNGRYLYGSVIPGNRDWNDTFFGTRVDRVRLPEGVIDGQFEVVDHFNQSHSVSDLLAIPGQPLEILIARSGPQNDVALYSSGGQSARSPVDLYAFHLAGIPGVADEFLAYSLKDPAHLFRLHIGPSSLSVVRSARDALTAYSKGLWVAGGRIYDSGGGVADLSSLSHAAQTTGGSIAAADADEDLVLFLRSENGRWIIRAFRASTTEALWFYDALEPFHAPVAFLGCGRGLFALLSDDGRLFLIQSRLLPGVPVSNLAVVSDLTRVEGAPAGATWFDLRLDVTNRGPASTGAIVLTNVAPADSTIVESSVPYEVLTPGTSEAGSNALPASTARLLLAEGLDGHASTTIRLRFQSSAKGTVTNEVTVVAQAQDPDVADNIHRASVYQPVEIQGGRLIEGFAARELAYDRSRQILYVSSTGVGVEKGRLHRMEPASGRFLEPLNSGPQPTLLALGEDSRFLYVAVDSGQVIERHDLAAGTVDLRWDLGELLLAETMVVSPSDSRLVAIALERSGGGSPRHAGVVLYRDGVALPDRSGLPVWANTIAFSADGSVLFGYDNETSGYGVHRFQVSPSGVVRSATWTGLIDGSSHRIAQAGGLLFASSGVIVDPEQGSVVGRLAIDPPQHPEFTHAMKIDVHSGSAFFTTGTGAAARLWHFRMTDQTPLGSVPIPAIEPAAAIETWGDHGVAVALGSGGLFLGQFPFATAVADPELRLEVSTNLVESGQMLTYTVTLTNRGAARATGLMVKFDMAPTTTHTGAMTSTQGFVWPVIDGIQWVIDSLPPHGFASASWQVLVAGPGLVFGRAVVTSESPDSNATNNRAILYGSATGASDRFHLPAVDTLYDPNQDRVFASLGTTHEAILPLDPHTWQFGTPIPIPGGANAMILDSDQRQIRVALRTGGFLTLDPSTSPPTLSPVVHIGVDSSGAPMLVVAMASLLGRPETTAIAARVSTEPPQFQIAIFDGATARPDRAVITDATRIDALAFESDGLSLHIGADTGYRRHSVGSRGVTETSMSPARADLPGRFVPANGWLYFEAGPVITAAPERPGSPLVAGLLPFPGILAVSSTTDQLFVLNGGGDTGAIKALRATTLREAWEKSFTPVGAADIQLLVTGTNRVLARFGDGTALSVGSEAFPATPSSDLRLSAITPFDWSSAGAVFAYTVTLENAGPWSAPGVRVVHSRPSGLEWNAIEVSQGAQVVTGKDLVWDVGLLSSHRVARITFQCRALVPGIHPAVASVASDVADPNPNNNTIGWELLQEQPPGISVSDFTYFITSDRSAFFEVPVVLSSRSSLAITASVTATNSTAVAGTDFVVSRPLLTIPPGRTEAGVRINLLPQAQPLAERAFVLGLSNVTQARLFRDHATIRLRDARVPTVMVSGGSQLEGAKGAHAAVPFTISLTSTFPEPVRVEYQTVDDTALAGLDYRPARGTMVFAPGVTNLTLSVDIYGNDEVERDRRLRLSLGNVANGRLGMAEAEGIIVDDDRVDVRTVSINHIRVEDDTVRIGYIATAGLTVVVEAAQELTPPVVWRAVSGPRLSDGRIIEVTDTPEGERAYRFYRLSVVP